MVMRELDDDSKYSEYDAMMHLQTHGRADFQMNGFKINALFVFSITRHVTEIVPNS